MSRYISKKYLMEKFYFIKHNMEALLSSDEERVNEDRCLKIAAEIASPTVALLQEMGLFDDPVLASRFLEEVKNKVSQ